ncbi:MAG: V-type ATP synthase subunit K [Treponema sp.]|jgi:V/A-type H+-transporting ATPase subunit K|nr:V-type ATP synthase subunit K [Treponema sp.]
MNNLGVLGANLLLGITALGAGIGIMIAGAATIGAWKKCYNQKKAAPMLLLAFTGNPLTQVLYAYVLMGAVRTAAIANPANGLAYLGLCAASALALAGTAYAQGKIAACAVETLVDTGKGFAQFYIVMGIAETVALFTLVFSMGAL